MWWNSFPDTKHAFFNRKKGGDKWKIANFVKEMLGKTIERKTKHAWDGTLVIFNGHCKFFKNLVVFRKGI